MWGSEWTSASGGQVEGITFVRVSSLKFHLKQMGKLRPGGVDLSPSLTEALFRASLTARPFSAHRGACPGRARSPPAPHPSSRIRSTWRLIPKLGLPRAVLKCCWTALRSFTQGALVEHLQGWADQSGERKRNRTRLEVSEVAASRLGVKGVQEVSEGAIPPASSSRQALRSLPHSKVPRNWGLSSKIFPTCRRLYKIDSCGRRRWG